MPSAKAASLSAPSQDPIGDALCDAYLEDEQLWVFGEPNDLRAAAARGLTRNPRGGTSLDGPSVYVLLLSRRVPELPAQAFILRVEARLARLGVTTVLPAPVLRLTPAQRQELIAPPPPPEPAPPPPPPKAETPAAAEIDRGPVATDPKTLQQEARRLSTVLRATAGVVVGLLCVTFGVISRAGSEITVSRNVTLKVPAAAAWEVASRLDQQIQFAPWLAGATAPNVVGELLQAQVDGRELQLRRWSVVLGTRVETRVLGENALASVIELSKDGDDTSVTWTVNGQRGLAGVFGDVAGERGSELEQGLKKFETAATAVAAEQAAAAARAAEEERAAVAAVTRRPPPHKYRTALPGTPDAPLEPTDVQEPEEVKKEPLKLTVEPTRKRVVKKKKTR